MARQTTKTKQELISIKFSVEPDENERRVKEIYHSWKDDKVHKERIFRAILREANEPYLTDSTMIDVLIDLADSLQSSVNKLASIDFSSASMSKGSSSTEEFDNTFNDTMLSAWDN